MSGGWVAIQHSSPAPSLHRRNSRLSGGASSHPSWVVACYRRRFVVGVVVVRELRLGLLEIYCWDRSSGRVVCAFCQHRLPPSLGGFGPGERCIDRSVCCMRRVLLVGICIACATVCWLSSRWCSIRRVDKHRLPRGPGGLCPASAVSLLCVVVRNSLLGGRNLHFLTRWCLRVCSTPDRASTGRAAAAPRQCGKKFSVEWSDPFYCC